MRKPFVFKIRGGTEFRAAKRLLQFHVMPMNPCEYVYTRRQPGGEAVLDPKPLLPGYFVGMFPTDCWFVLRNVMHEDGTKVLGAPLSPDGVMRPLSPQTFADINDLNSYSAEAPVIEKQRGLSVGQTVILKGGLHAGKRFRLERTSKCRTRATAVIRILGALREVTVTEDAVEIVEAAA